MTPKTTTENLLLWAIALALAILLSFLTALAKQLPGDAPINMRAVWLDVITTVLTLAPVVAAGFGLPRLGKEGVASLVSEVGPTAARAALEVEATRQATGVARPSSVAVSAPNDVTVTAVADELERRARRHHQRDAGPQFLPGHVGKG